jgi:hypothetical protein
MDHAVNLFAELAPALRLSAGINVPILRRIWIRFQGASMGAYSLYVPMDATEERLDALEQIRKEYNLWRYFEGEH